MSRLIGQWIRGGYESFEQWRFYSNSRKKAHQHRSAIAKKKDKPVVGPHEINMTKEYAGDVFGDTGYWPWLACYMEIRGSLRRGGSPLIITATF